MTPQEASIRSRELCLLAPVIPVLVVDDASNEYLNCYGTSSWGNLRKAGMASCFAETVALYFAVAAI